MEILEGNFNQRDYNELITELMALDMLRYLGKATQEELKRLEEIQEILKENINHERRI